MKKILLTLALPLLITAGLAPRAEAQNCRSSSQTWVAYRGSCGCPVYMQRYISHYNHCGQPVWQIRKLPVRHHCGYGRSQRHYQHGHGYRHGYQRGCSTGYRSNVRVHSPVAATVPRITFKPGSSVHVGFGLRR